MEGRGVWAKLVLAAAIVAGVSYLAAPQPEGQVVWKGAGVGLLTLYAALLARTGDGWLITLVMAFGALGDVMLNLAGLEVGAVFFFLGHVTAVVLYLRNRRPELSMSQGLLAGALLIAVPIAAYLLPADRTRAPLAAIYAGGLALMTASAWISRFPRYRTGLGAVMFAASDLLIFAENGPLAGQGWTGFAVWSLYFAGQTLICLGVTRTLSKPQLEAGALL
jgi:uncharacterized membrane protein YhhN